MNASPLSPLQMQALEVHNDSRRQAARAAGIDAVRTPTEQAIALNREAARVRNRILQHDANPEWVAAQVRRDRTDFALWIVFVLMLCAYLVIEWMTSGDIASMLANGMAPHFGLKDGETVPRWLIRAAGAGFVGLMLMVTIMVKIIASYGLDRAHNARAALMPGQEVSHRKFTSQIRWFHLLKVLYVCAVGLLYCWLYGFAAQRGVLMAQMGNAAAEMARVSNSTVSFEDGGVKDTSSSGEGAKSKSETEAAGRMLAGASAVFFAMIVCMHAGLLCLPVSNPARPLEYLGFSRSKFEAKLDSLVARRDQNLRDIYERVRRSEGEQRSDLLEATEPVHGMINQSLFGGRFVVGDPNIVHPQSWSDPLNDPLLVSTGSPVKIVSANTHFGEPMPQGADSGDQAGVGWDDIFPKAV